MSNPLLSEKKPVVAVLTVDDNDRLFRGNRNNFRDLVKTGQELDYPVYVVTAKDLKLSAKRIQGYLFHPEDKTWKKHWFPLPDVVYNRIPQREDEKKPEVRRKIDEVIEHESIHLFNPFFFNKRRLFEWLKKGRATKNARAGHEKKCWGRKRWLRCWRSSAACTSNRKAAKPARGSCCCGWTRTISSRTA
ncbi:hypothetical protein HMSSN139_22460 [Paenibacillus sp. HMSSN-139]|nr:hypothetical protein HMSSN139_22460 [Paenibacillus sp. HMSSN-139]